MFKTIEYKLKLTPYKIDEVLMNDFYYINSECIPRTNEIIEKIRIQVEDDNEKMNDYLLKVKIREVHYELFEDDSAMPVLYGDVIEIKKVESDE